MFMMVTTVMSAALCGDPLRKRDGRWYSWLHLDDQSYASHALITGIWLHSYRYHIVGPPTKTFQTLLPTFTQDFDFEIPPVPADFCRPPGESRSIFGRKGKK